MFDDVPPPPFRHWMRHMAAVPKGFLRYQVLELLSEKSLSGSEIMSEIERRTNGFWRPSPGSVYPLLAWLQDNGYIEEASTKESGIKRYLLTDKGKSFLEDQRKIRMQFRDKAKFLPQPFLGVMWRGLPSGWAARLREASSRFLKEFASVGANIGEKFSEHFIEETVKVLNEAADRLEEINRRMKGYRDE